MVHDRWSSWIESRQRQEWAGDGGGGGSRERGGCVVLVVDGARPKAGGGRAGEGTKHELGWATINIGCVTWRRERAQARELQAVQSTAGKTARQMQHATCNMHHGQWAVGSGRTQAPHTQDTRRKAHARAAGEAVGWAWAAMGAGGGLEFGVQSSSSSSSSSSSPSSEVGLGWHLPRA
jgi:hypothetical protein